MIHNLSIIPATAPKPGSRWKHWKEHCIAQVIAVGIHTESTEVLVSYMEENSGIVFFRPLSMWQDEARPGVVRFVEIP